MTIITENIVRIFLGISFYLGLYVIKGLTPCDDDHLPSQSYVFPDNSVACFWLNSMIMNFTDNDLQCRAKNGYMAYIPDQGVFDAVQNLRSQYGYVMTDYYLGYTELDGSLYTLAGDLVTFSHFASTEPSSDADTCIAIYGTTGIYYDEPCSNKYFGVCSSLPNSRADLDTTTKESTMTSEIPTTSLEQDSQAPNSHCPCSCSFTFHLNPNVNLTADEEARILEMKQNLTVEKSTLSSSVRRRTCASDDRASSQTVGVLGACFLGLTFGLMVLADCPRIINFVK